MIHITGSIGAKLLAGILSPKKDSQENPSKYAFLILAIIPIFVCFFGMMLNKAIDSHGLEKMEKFQV